jgi:hypothetical protein
VRRYRIKAPISQGDTIVPRYRFSWDNFDDETVGALAAACGFSASEGPSPREWLAENVKRPSDSFVRRTKTVLEDVWLPKHPRTVRQLVNFLAAIGIGPRVEPETVDGIVDYIRSCRNCKTFRYVLANALISHGDADRKRGDDEGLFDDTMFPCLVSLDPKKQPVLSLKPYELRWTPETGPGNKVELNPYLLGGVHGQKAEAA